MNKAKFQPAVIGVLTISDTRSQKDDKSGQYLVDAATAAGHTLLHRKVVVDEACTIRSMIDNWLLDLELEVIITTGGTGFSTRDVTIEAISSLIKFEIPGFGEHFREVSRKTIGSSAMLSRAMAGFTGDYRLIFCLPGSPGACKDGWENIINKQIDGSTLPCNLVEQTRRYRKGNG